MDMRCDNRESPENSKDNKYFYDHMNLKINVLGSLEQEFQKPAVMVRTFIRRIPQRRGNRFLSDSSHPHYLRKAARPISVFSTPGDYMQRRSDSYVVPWNSRMLSGAHRPINPSKLSWHPVSGLLGSPHRLTSICTQKTKHPTPCGRGGLFCSQLPAQLCKSSINNVIL